VTDCSGVADLCRVNVIRNKRCYCGMCCWSNYTIKTIYFVVSYNLHYFLNIVCLFLICKRTTWSCRYWVRHTNHVVTISSEFSKTCQLMKDWLLVSGLYCWMVIRSAHWLMHIWAVFNAIVVNIVCISLFVLVSWGKTTFIENNDYHILKFEMVIQAIWEYISIKLFWGQVYG